jgi:hypothetical protein
MIPAPHYQHLDAMLNAGGANLGIHHVPSIPGEPRLLGFVFFSQNYERDPAKDFIKNINVLNIHSAEHIHFLLPGISLYGPNEGDDSTELGKLDGTTLYYNPRAFSSFKEEFEKKIDGWNFDYGMDLVLTNIVGERPTVKSICKTQYFSKLTSS